MHTEQAHTQNATTLTPAVRVARPALALLLLLALALWNLSGPAPWWDEGWTLSVARNLAERGHYGRLQAGELASGGLEASPIITLPVAAAFEVFGVGLWQGRLFSALCTVGALLLMWWLAAQLFDRRIAAVTLATLLLLSAHPQLNPLLLGRQALGELPMLLFALGGYAALLAALRGRALWIIPAVLLWWLATNSKAQFMPFWVISLLAPLLVALLWRQWRAAILLVLALVAGYLVQTPLTLLLLQAIGERRMVGEPVEGLLDVVAVVTQSFNRIYALQNLLFFAMPAALGLLWGAWRTLSFARSAPPDAALLVRISLLALAGSWMGWFALLSVGVPRYLFPAAFVGALFAAALLADLTGGYNLLATLRSLTAPRRNLRACIGGWLAILLVAATLPLTLLGYARYYPVRDESAQRVAALLDAQVAPEQLIETYEAELHFFLNRRYHFPPDQTHVELNRRSLLRQETPISYDPLAADPDYLVVGTFARGNRLYADVIARGDFELLQRDGPYEVYQRVRTGETP
jgi:4-amino-4-deoxy-L-arabinose transferase-like glycosyltransferase